MPLDAITAVQQNLEHTGWMRPSTFPSLGSGEVDVWLVNLTTPISLKPQSCLLVDEIERAARFRFERDREHFINCRVALRTLLSRYLGAEPCDVEFGYGPKGKPFLRSGMLGRLNFNVSHSGQYALIAVSDHEIGVDIEKHDQRFIESGTLELCLSPNERQGFDALTPANQLAAFFDTWTAKEAYLKLAGDGLFVEPNRLDLCCWSRDLTRAPIDGHDVYFNRTPDLMGYSTAIAAANSFNCRFLTFLANCELPV